MRTIYASKEPNETYSYAIDFKEDIAAGEAIVSVKINGIEDFKIEGTIVTFKVPVTELGKNQVVYNVRVTTNFENVYEANVIFEIKEQAGVVNLVLVSELKSYLKIEHNEEDVLLSEILREVEGLFRSLLHRAIEAVKTEEIIYPEGRKTTLFLRNFPIVLGKDAPFTITDGEGNEIKDYELNTRTGEVIGIWEGQKYKVTYTGGLSLHPDYETQILPSIKRAIKFWAADTYYHRSPRVTSEKLGDESTSIEGIEMPKSVAMIVRLHRSV